MEVGRHLRSCITVALLIVLLAPAGFAATGDRPPSVVVKVEGGGFHWGDAAVGAAATLAAGLLVLGLVLIFRPAGRRVP